jgi:hypothetical protein
MSHLFDQWSAEEKREYLKTYRGQLSEHVEELKKRLHSIDEQLAGRTPLVKKDVVCGYRRAECDARHREPCGTK